MRKVKITERGSYDNNPIDTTIDNGYAIYCTQRNIYFPADEKSKFNSLKEIKEQLLSYHSIDIDKEDINKIKKWSAFEIANQFDWEIHDYKTEEEINESR